MLLLEAGGRMTIICCACRWGFCASDRSFPGATSASRNRAWTAAAVAAARQGAGRIRLDQWHVLHARPLPRLRRLARPAAARGGDTGTCCRTSSASSRGKARDAITGGSGPLAVEPIKTNELLEDAMMRPRRQAAITSRGLQFAESRHSPRTNSASTHGRAPATSRAYLRPIMRRPNLTVRTPCDGAARAARRQHRRAASPTRSAAERDGPRRTGKSS